ncbi:acyltransferase [Shinella sp.]|uniref:acyltransferase n=1 Tax=Shinella sp. TaxID=1870904 RepID=UPI0028B1F500|nr:acyltransferase [Shinella sp.]
MDTSSTRNKLNGTRGTERLLWADGARSLACIMVVFVHAASPSLIAMRMSAGYAAIQALAVISMAGVPIFAMLTGSLILSRSASPDPVKYSILKPIKIAALIVIWNAVFALLQSSISSSTFTFWGSLRLAGLGAPNNPTLWYMYQLFGLYLILPVIYSFVRNSSALTVALFVALGVTAGFVPFVARVAFDAAIWSPAPLFVIALWPAYMMAGYLVTRHKEALAKYTLEIFGMVVLCAVLNFIGNMLTTSPSRFIHQYENVTTFAMSVGAFFLIAANADRLSRSKALQIAAREVSAAGLGIYLIHYPVLVTIRTFIDPVPTHNVIISTAICLTISFAITRALLLIPYFRKTVTL